MSIWVDKVVVYIVHGPHRGRALRGGGRAGLVLGDPGVRLDLRADRDRVLPALPRVLRRARGRRAAAPAARARRSITAETERILRGAGLVQAAVTLVALLRRAVLDAARRTVVARRCCPFRLAVRRRRAAGDHAARDPGALLLRSATRCVLDVAGAVRRRSGAHARLLGARVADGDRLHRRLRAHLRRRCRSGAAAPGNAAGRHVPVAAVRGPNVNRRFGTLLRVPEDVALGNFSSVAYSFLDGAVHCFRPDNCWIRDGKFVRDLLRPCLSRVKQ